MIWCLSVLCGKKPNKLIFLYLIYVGYDSLFMNVDLLSFWIKPLCFTYLFSVKVQFSAEAASLLPKISFTSEENATALNTKLLKTSEQSSDSDKNLAKTSQKTDSKGRPAKLDLCVLSPRVPGWCGSSSVLWSHFWSWDCWAAWSEVAWVCLGPSCSQAF